MIKNKKGFTLIELLATIVIIAIILLITVPLITNVISNVKKQAFKSSVYGLVNTAEIESKLIAFDNPSSGNVYFNYKNGVESSNYIKSNNEEAKLNYKGNKMKNGNLIIREDGKIYAAFHDGNWCAVKDYDNNIVEMSQVPLEDCISDIEVVVFHLIGNNTEYVELNLENYFDKGVVAKTMDNVTLETSFKIFNANDEEVSEIDITKLGEWTIVYSTTFLGVDYTLSRTVIVRDTTKPIFTIPEDIEITIGDVSNFNPMIGVSEVTDNSGEDIEIIVTSDLVSYPGIYTITYSAKDSSGNETVKTRKVTVIDNILPKVKFIPNGNDTYAKTRTVKINVEDEYSGIDASSLKYVWTTSLEEPSINEFINSFNNNVELDTLANVTGDYYLWIRAKDNSGNEVIENSNAFKLDNTKPIITLTGSSAMTIDKGSSWTDPGATASDAHSGVNNSDIIITGSVNPNIAGVYTLYYNVKDKAGNEATEVTRTVTVVDVKAPVITIKGDNPKNIYVDQVYIDEGASALDDVDGDVTGSIVTTGSVTPSISGIYYITYTVSDSAGNTATAKRTVYVVDNVPPIVSFGTNGNSTYQKSQSTMVSIIDLHGSVSTMQYQWTTSSSFPTGGTWTNFVNSGLTITQNNGTGDYYLHIKATDNAGNEAKLTSNVFKLDNTAPVISSMTISASSITENSFTINRSGNASDAHSDLATNPYIYQISTNNSSWTTKSTTTASSYKVTGLSEDTTYYYRICVQDKLGNEACISSKCVKTKDGNLGTFTDSRDGYTYDTVKIGNQVWFAEDLRYDCSREGYTNVGSGTSGWSESACGNQDTGYNAMLYGWVAAMNGSTNQSARGLCPVGWHIPSDGEWKTLEGIVDSIYGVGHSEWDKNNARRGSDAGTKLKDTSTNGIGFKALLSGYRYIGGTFNYIGSYGRWWSSSESGLSAYSRTLYSPDSTVHRNSDSQAHGYSVRCVRDL